MLKRQGNIGPSQSADDFSSKIQLFTQRLCQRSLGKVVAYLKKFSLNFFQKALFD
jgi:hypothetical protein